MPTTPPTVVRTDLAMELLAPGADGAGVVLRVPVGWCATDPHRVHLSFPAGGEWVRWVIGRELLADGVDRPVGLGDVSVLPDPFHPERCELVLSTDSGRACFRIATADLRRFLTRTGGAR